MSFIGESGHTSPMLPSVPALQPEHCVIRRERSQQREFFIDNLMVRIHLIIVMILVDRPCAMGV